MTTQPPPSAADLLEQCAEALRECCADLESELNARYPPNVREFRCMQQDFDADMTTVREARKVLAAIDSHRAQSAEVAGDGPVAWAQPSLLTWAYRSTEKVVKLTRKQQAEYGFVTPLYAAPPSAPVRMEEARTARGGVTEAVRALVGKLRLKHGGLVSDKYALGVQRGIELCAEQVEAAMSAAPVPDTSAVRAPHEGRKTT